MLSQSSASRASSGPMLSVRGLSKSVRASANTKALEILKDVSFSVPAGQFLAIMGASGSGKSTLLGLLAGLDTPTSGEVLLAGQSISYMAEDRLAQVRGRLLGFVFQSYQLIPTLTALENVLLPHELNAEAKAAGGSAADGLARARELLQSVGLGERMSHYPVQLSVVDQKIIKLARAFVLRPPIILADEPTGNLDSTNGKHVLELLVNLNRVEGTTLVLVTHDAAVAALAHRRLTMRDGEILSDELSNGDAVPEAQSLIADYRMWP